MYKSGPDPTRSQLNCAQKEVAISYFSVSPMGNWALGFVNACLLRRITYRRSYPTFSASHMIDCQTTMEKCTFWVSCYNLEALALCINVFFWSRSSPAELMGDSYRSITLFLMLDQSGQMCSSHILPGQGDLPDFCLFSSWSRSLSFIPVTQAANLVWIKKTRRDGASLPSLTLSLPSKVKGRERKHAPFSYPLFPF